MDDPVNIPTPVANGSLEDAQNFVNTLPGNMTPQQRQAIAESNPGWHPPATSTPPDTLPANFSGWDKDKAPDTLPGNFSGWDKPKEAPPKSFDDPRVSQLGYYVNGDGNTVIAPKDGEEYSDTIKRAVEHSQKMTEQERQGTLDRETSNLGTKVAGTLGIAGATGLGGAALLALTAETPEALKQIATKAPAAYQAARTFIYHRLAAATPELFGEEAAKATLKRIAVKGAMKLATGGAVGAGMAMAHAVWEELLGK